MKKSSIALLSFILLGFFVIINACNKNNERTFLQVHLTDNPYDAQEVNIDLKEVNVNLTDDSSGWQKLQTVSGVYNLLNLQNGVDTLVGTDNLPSGTLKEIRFVLGSDNSIVINNVKYPLSIPSGSESGLKIKVNKKLQAGLDSLIIDFDAALSVVKIDESNYHLKPVLRVK
jgi:hypothetical protein